MSVISKLTMLGAAGSGVSPYWVFQTTDSASVTPAENFDIDSSDNSFLPVQVFDTAASGILKVSTEGELLAAAKFQFSGSKSPLANGLIVRSDDTPVVFGYANDSTYATWKPGFWYRFNDSLTTPSSFRLYRYNTTQYIYAGKFLINSTVKDTSGNFYSAGSWNYNSSSAVQNNYGFFTKTTSSFSTSYTNRIGSTNSRCKGVAAKKTITGSSSDYIWVMYYSYGDGIVRIRASDGSIGNMYRLNTGNFGENVTHAVDSNDNCYAFLTNGTGLKFAPNAGNLSLVNSYTWTIPSGFSSFTFWGSTCETVDSTDYIFVKGYGRHVASNRYGIFFIRYDTSFNFIDGTMVTNSNSNLASYKAIKLDSQKNVMLYAGIGSQTVLMKMPYDSSVSGTFGDWNVYTFSAPTRSVGSISLTSHSDSGSGLTMDDDSTTRTVTTPTVPSTTTSL